LARFGAYVLRNGEITTDHLADDAVTTEKLADEAVTEEKLENDAVTSDKIKDGEIRNAQIHATARIAYSKLNLTGEILNADIKAAAAIAYSKLDLTDEILNADIAAAAAIISSKLSAGKIPLWVPYNGKIADITHGDTSKHTLDLEAALTETRTIIAVQVGAGRISGSGAMAVYPNEGTAALALEDWTVYTKLVTIAAGTQRLQYNLDTSGDDFDLYCYGYIVEV